MLTANPSTILIVDDQPTNLKMLFSFLQESGFKVLVAQSGESAITKLDKVAPDLILLDVMLPGLDGFETCRRLKATAETQVIPVIFMTALSESLDKIKGLKVGAVDYITKPFQQEEVLARIENQLKIRRLSVQLEAQDQQLQQSQSLLASVLNTSQDGVMVFEAIRDSGGKIVDFKWILANPAAEKMTGRTSHDLLGKQLLVELPGNREAGLFDRYVTVAETGMPQEREFYYDYDGIKAWFVHVAVKLGDGFAVTFRDISDRKQAADALLIAQKRLEYLLSSSPAIIYTCKLDNYRTTFISENITLLLGYTTQEYLEDSRFWESHIHPDDKEGILAEFPQLLERRQHSFEYRFLHQDGTYRWLLDVLKLVRDEEGNPIECIGSMSDITQRKQVEAELQESQRWLSAITEANPNILYVYDLIERRNIYINREVYTILGYTPEEVEQMGITVLQSLMHPEDFAAVPKHFRCFESAKDGEILEFEDRMRHKKGEWHWLFARETVFTRNTDGKPKQILGTATDISDRKAIEIALQQSEARLQNLAANVPGMLYEFLRYSDGSFGFAYVSSGCRDIIELEPEQIVENSAPVFEQVHPDDEQSLYDSLEASSQTLEAWAWEGRIITPSGKLKWIQGAARPEHCDNGEILWHGLTIDVSDRVLVQESLRESEERFRSMADSTAVLLWMS